MSVLDPLDFSPEALEQLWQQAREHMRSRGIDPDALLEQAAANIRENARLRAADPVAWDLEQQRALENAPHECFFDDTPHGCMCGKRRPT